MKRMSEVFELPIRPQPSDSKYFQHLLFDGSGSDEPIGSFNNCQMAISAMKAINHIDALADALGDIVFDYFATINLSNVDMATLNPELHKKMTVATDALAAYRGDK